MASDERLDLEYPIHNSPVRADRASDWTGLALDNVRL